MRTPKALKLAYASARAEGIVYDTPWTGRRVIGMSDCLRGGSSDFIAAGRAEYRWPGHRVQSFGRFVEQPHTQRFLDAPLGSEIPTTL